MNTLNKTALIGLALSSLASAVAQADQTVLIGLAGPLTGPSARIGKDLENGARLAIDQANAKHPKINGEAVTFKLVSEDDQSDPRTAVTVAQRLVDEGVVGVVGHWNTGTSIPAARVYHDAGIAQVAPVATGHAYTQQGFDTSFRIMGHDDDGGQVAGDYALNTLKAKRIAVIDDRTAYGQGVADEFVKGAKKALPGVQIVAKEFTNDKATDFNAILTKIKSKNPDLVFFGGMDSVGGPLLRQMKALGINAKYMGGDGICTESMPKLAGAANANGIVTCAEAGGVSAEQQKGMDDFVARYKKKYNADVQIYSPYVYDAVMTLATAMQEAKSSQPAKYLPFLQKIKYQGVTGLITFDAKGDIKDGALTLFTYKDGKKTKIEVIH